MSRGAGLGVRRELPLLLVELGGPLQQSMSMPLVGDPGFVQLMRREPLVFLAQLGGQLGDRRAILDRQLAVAKESGQVRVVASPSAASFCSLTFSSAGVVVLSAIPLSRVATVSATISRFKGR